MRRENAFYKFHIIFWFCLPCFLYTMIWNKNKIRCIDAPKYAFTHRNLPESERYIWFIQNVHEKSRFLRDSWVSCNQTLGWLRLYGDSRDSRAQTRINAYDKFLQHDWLLFFSRHNMFAEIHSFLQLSYQITDRLLAAGNKVYVSNLWGWYIHIYISSVVINC